MYNISIRAPKGSPVGLAGKGGVAFKILSAGQDSRKENAFLQNCRNSRTVKILSH